ncbi:MAG: hypothetical protein J6U68_02365 [Clostridia bacterium]|nr:hypothetical protein [Clostridia bacterium]
MKKLLRFFSFILIFILLLGALTSCGDARPLAQGKLAKTTVGTVGSHDVPYEEFYYLANNYYAFAKDKYGDDTEAIDKYVWDSINENIITNYAIIDLCAAEGLEYDEGALRADVESSIEKTILSSFDGDRGAFLDSLLASGITDHYYRFCIGVDILYARLATKYQESGKVPTTDEAITSHIKENFIHTWHIAIYVDEGDDYEEELAKAKEAKRLLDDGNSIYTLTKNGINEDLMLSSLSGVDGYYFSKGMMDKDYENAAFDLEKVGDRSDIVISYGEAPSGNYVKCFYIIEKLAVKDSEIKENFTDLSDMVKDSILASDLEKYESQLSFTPNDYASSLNFASLEAPKNGADYQVIIAICVSIASVILIVVAIFVFRSVRAKRFHKKHNKKNNRQRLK